MSAKSKIAAARTSLVLEEPFFASLILKLQPKVDETCETAWTDGRNIGFNPSYVEQLTHSELVALLAEEVMHNALGHPWRRDGRNHKRFNIACDKAIYDNLIQSGYTAPSDSCLPTAEEKGKSAEWICDRMGDDGEQEGQGNGQGNGKGRKPVDGEVRDAPTEPDTEGNPAPTESEWKQAVANAFQQAKMMGRMPAGMARALESALRPRLDVRSLLLRFFSERSMSDFSWSRPNPRYLCQSLYLPALESHSLGDVAVMIDTSGSVDQTSLAYARGVVEQVINECQPSGVGVYYVDADVCRVDRFEKGESLEWHPCGGGGTNFTSFFDRVERGEYSPVCVVAISDLYATFPSNVPAVPVLWLSTTEGANAPFGETVYLER